MAGGLTLWELSCLAYGCDRKILSDQGINQTKWDYEAEGWSLVISEGGQFNAVFCPDHTTAKHSEPTWIAECHDCHWEEEFHSKRDAHAATIDHESDHCELCDHYTKVEHIDDRRERIREAQKRWKRHRMERDGYDRYVAFLIDQDQQRRQEMNRHKSESQMNRDRVLLITSMTVLGIMLVLFMLFG